MSDVLIKGMEMPKDCRYCPCVRFDKEYGIVSCRAVYDNHNDEDVVARDYDEWDMLDTTRSKPLVKPSWCPLIPVPEHNDLADKSVIIERMGDAQYELWDKVDEKALSECHVAFLKAVMYAPTVLEAST